MDWNGSADWHCNRCGLLMTLPFHTTFDIWPRSGCFSIVTAVLLLTVIQGRKHTFFGSHVDVPTCKGIDQIARGWYEGREVER